MTRFRGNYEYSVDAKGRLNIPAKFRKSLKPEAQETFVIVRGPDRCLQAFPLDCWSRVEDELEARPLTPDTVRLRRQLYQSISDSKLDAQGRIALTPGQMSIAGITGKVVLQGQGSCIEIWSPERHSRYFGEGEDFDEVYYRSVKDSLDS